METLQWLITIQGFLIGGVYCGDWTAWGHWVFGTCSTTCGPGTQKMTRKRSCHRTYAHTPYSTSMGCYVGKTNEEATGYCNITPCPEAGAWSAWTNRRPEGLCSISCGHGKGTTRVSYDRSCTNPIPMYGGKQCEGVDVKFTKEECVAKVSCTVVAAGWGEWIIHSTGPCSATCGPGTKQIVRKRLCDNPPPKRGAEDCFGNSMQFITKACESVFICKVHGGWSHWTQTNTTQCSVTCGSGHKRVFWHRVCNNPFPKNGGRTCVGMSLESKMLFCKGNVTCIVDGGWGDYKKYSEGECSVTCGSGTKEVLWKRICDNPTPTYDGQPCVGNSSASSMKDCNTGTTCKVVESKKLVTTASPPPPQALSESNTGVIAGSLVGVFIAGCLVAVVVIVYRKSKRDKADASVTARGKEHRHVTTNHNPAFVPDRPSHVK